MDPEIGAALITGVSSLAAGLGGGWLGGKKQGERKVRAKLESQAEINSSSLHDQMIDFFGLKIGHLKSAMKISDTGDCVVTRSFREVEIVQGSSISHIPGKFETLTPGARIISGPEVSIVNGFSKLVDAKITRRTDQRCEFVIDIAGDLDSGDDGLNFDIAIEYSGNVLMDMGSVRSAYANDIFKWDYLFFDVQLPVDNLEIDVSFPEAKKFEMYSIVFFGSSEHIHHNESRRVARGFEATSGRARLMVDKPRIGFRYAVYWKPPA